MRTVVHTPWCASGGWYGARGAHRDPIKLHRRVRGLRRHVIDVSDLPEPLAEHYESAEHAAKYTGHAFNSGFGTLYTSKINEMQRVVRDASVDCVWVECPDGLVRSQVVVSHALALVRLNNLYTDEKVRCDKPVLLSTVRRLGHH